MTLFRIEHAVVMDTDDIPGRGGYAVVGISRGVTQAERVFVAGNFAISDYLHDPKTENRIFYSTFRIPNGRRAFVRRFAKGLRRNQTQNRLFIHTLLLDDDVFRTLGGLPWLLVNASVRPEGSADWDRLRDDVPWVRDDGSLPALEWDSDDGVTTGVVARFQSRLTAIGNQFPRLPGGAASPSDAVARLISALPDRVAVPQGLAYEWLTMLAWSMLPRGDREELAWTQHDTMNVAGVTFHLANVVMSESESAGLHRPAAPFARTLVDDNLGSEESWREVHDRMTEHQLSVRRPADLFAWQQWRNALRLVGSNIRENARDHDTALVTRMTELADTAQANPEAAWINGREVLELIWPNVSRAVADQQPAEIVVKNWAGRLHRSRLSQVIFRTPPDRDWLTGAAVDVGADLLVWFFLSGTEDYAAARPARTAVAQWLIENDRSDVTAKTMAALALRLGRDQSPALLPLLERLLASAEGLEAFRQLVQDRTDAGELVAVATPIAIKRAHPATLAFVRDVFVPRAAANVDAALAQEVALVLRDDPPAFLRFAARVTPEIAARLMELVPQWVFREPKRSVALARDLLRQIQRDSGTMATAGPLAFALASAGEPARVWFHVILQLARNVDGKNDPKETRGFLDALKALGERTLNLDGAMDLLVAHLKDDAQLHVRPGECVRALVLFLRPAWAGADDLAGALIALIGQQTYSARVWEQVVSAFAADHASTRLRHDVSNLVTAFWQKVDPSEVPSLSPAIFDALACVTGDERSQLSKHWSRPLRVQTLPHGPASDRLLSMLVHEQAGASREVRASLALRDVEKGVADERTLNRLDAALHAMHGPGYGPHMARALETRLGPGGAVPRMVSLLELLASNAVAPTVQLVLEERVLPRAVRALDPKQWQELRVATHEDELLPAGLAALLLARGAGAEANDATIRELQEVYRRHHRKDALDELDAGRATRGPLRWLARTLGFEGR